MPIGPLSQTTICLNPIVASIQSDQRANCGSGPPPPPQQQQQQPGDSKRLNSSNAQRTISLTSGPSLRIGRVGFWTPVLINDLSTRPSAISHRAIKSSSLLLWP